MGKHVQYGCGWSAPRTWLNFDASPTLRFERIPLIDRIYTKNYNRFPPNVEYGDILKGLPIQPNSCDAIYASHVLEHLALDDLRKALRNTLNLLAEGGIFRLVVPDLRALAEKYLSSHSEQASHEFMQESGLGLLTRPRGINGLVKTWMGNSAHLWMWDYQSMSSELTKSGFVNIRRCQYGDAIDSLYKDVESVDRFTNAVGIEARKTR